MQKMVLPSVLLQDEFLDIDSDIVSKTRLVALDFEALGYISIDEGLIQHLAVSVGEAFLHAKQYQ